MSRLRLLPYRESATAAEAAGFKGVRRLGSHDSFRSADGRILMIPDHGGQAIARPLVRKIVRDLGLTVDEYNRLAESV